MKATVYEHLTDREIARLQRQETGGGGGAQGHMYRLQAGLVATRRTVRVTDELYGKLLTMVRSSSFGGYQDRLPFELHIQILEELAREAPPTRGDFSTDQKFVEAQFKFGKRPADVQTVKEKRRAESAALEF